LGIKAKAANEPVSPGEFAPTDAATAGPEQGGMLIF
jgi:hypothetical protein